MESGILLAEADDTVKGYCRQIREEVAKKVNGKQDFSMFTPTIYTVVSGATEYYVVNTYCVKVQINALCEIIVEFTIRTGDDSEPLTDLKTRANGPLSFTK
eukprot:scpid80938/ scgid16962/ 